MPQVIVPALDVYFQLFALDERDLEDGTWSLKTGATEHTLVLCSRGELPLV